MNREKAAKWMETIHDDLRNAYIQDDLFWQFQDVVRENGRRALRSIPFVIPSRLQLPSASLRAPNLFQLSGLPSWRTVHCGIAA